MIGNVPCYCKCFTGNMPCGTSLVRTLCSAIESRTPFVVGRIIDVIFCLNDMFGHSERRILFGRALHDPIFERLNRVVGFLKRLNWKRLLT